ncbi:MAG: ATP-binding protein [Solirubrobacteraceae bacterium]
MPGNWMKMPLDMRSPDLEAQVQLDAYAPRFARHCVGQVDSPSPDLRDAVELLTSEVVTRAVELYDPGRKLALRIWMPHDVVRVELEVERDYSLGASGPTGDYALVLLDGLADRWSIEPACEPASVWFEIDRHAPAERADEQAPTQVAPPKHQLHSERSATARTRGGTRRVRSSSTAVRAPSRSA